MPIHTQTCIDMPLSNCSGIKYLQQVSVELYGAYLDIKMANTSYTNAFVFSTYNGILLQKKANLALHELKKKCGQL